LTLCTFDRGCYFDQFPQLRKIVGNQWHGILERFHNVILDEYVIMPNHFHGIIIIRDDQHECRDTPCGYPLPTQQRKDALQNRHLGDIVGAFKSICVNSWLKVIAAENINARGKFWQDNYFEHIIRNDYEMNRIRRYIADNPFQWEFDRENPTSDKFVHPKQTEKWMI